MSHIKRSNGEPWIENVWKTGCLEHALKQNTNGDEKLFLTYSPHLTRNQPQWSMEIMIFFLEIVFSLMHSKLILRVLESMLTLLSYFWVSNLLNVNIFYLLQVYEDLNK